jgi:hypothetical protein
MKNIQSCLVLSLLLGITSITLSGCSSTASIVAAGSTTTTPIGTTPAPAPEPTPTPAPVTSSTSDVAIASPSSGATVTSPFTLAAGGSTCSGQAVTSIGYSLDTGSIVTANGASLNTQVIAAAGAHTINVSASGASGATCAASVAITVAQSNPAPSQNNNVPSNAITVSNIQALPKWLSENDSAAMGASVGVMSLVTAPSVSGNARQFVTSFSNYGNERYWVSFDKDTAARNFFYDANVYIEGSAANLGNLEFDMNQVMANGQTVIYGFQCDGYAGTWDYTENAGTPTSPIDHWVQTTATCNPRNWTPNTWHHIQVSYSRDDSGNVTYQSVWLDGTEAKINATAPSSFTLGWGSTLLTNFQVDGVGSGTNTVYLDNVTISRW